MRKVIGKKPLQENVLHIGLTCNQRIQDRTNVKKILKRLQNKLLFSGFQKWYITIVKTRNVQQNMQLKEESEQYLRNYQRLEFENQKLKIHPKGQPSILGNPFAAK